MIECKVDSIRGKNIQRKITIRNCFDWTVRSVQTFSSTGIIADSTITQVVYERQRDYPHRAELEALEKDADKLVFPNVRPTMKKLTAMIILSVIFGGIYLAIPYVIAALVSLVDLSPAQPILLWIFLGLTGVFAIWILPLIIIAIVKKVKLKKNTKKMEAIIDAAVKIHYATPAVHPAAHPMVGQPVAPVSHPTPLPSMPKTEKPLIRPLVKPVTPQPTAPVTPAAPQPSVEPASSQTPPPTPEKPIE